MRKLKNYIFLTESEVKIHTSFQLSIHLNSKDPRVHSILQNKDQINLIILNPRISWLGTFDRNKWYLIPSPVYTGRMVTQSEGGTDKIVNISFNWRWKYRNYNPSKELKQDQIDFFRKNNYLNV